MSKPNTGRKGSSKPTSQIAQNPSSSPSLNPPQARSPMPAQIENLPESTLPSDRPPSSSNQKLEQLLSCFNSYYEPYPQPPKKISYWKQLHTTYINLVSNHNVPVVMEVEPSIGVELKDLFKRFIKNSPYMPLKKETNNFFPLDPTFKYNPKLQNFLYGRLLLLSECQAFTLEELKEHFKAGMISIEHGISCNEGEFPHCHRCGNTTGYRFAEHFCERCGQICLYCRECLEMGQIRQCSILVKWTGPDLAPYKGEVKCMWEGTLTPEQTNASAKLLQAVRDQEDFLTWAVTGAGKTEILYETIETLIREGKRVAIAAPRMDVILELDRRLDRVFPTLPRVALYADSPTPYTYTPFVLTTLHQLRRFNKAFDLIIIDEVDAFPFHGDKALEAVLNRALKQTGSKAFVTATPTRQMKKDYLEGRLKGVHIPIRFHRGPLPEPSFTFVGNWHKALIKKKVPTSLLKWLKKGVQNDRRIFLFVPEIKQVESLVAILKSRGLSVEGSHSEDPERREKVLAFREGKHNIMVTTTILERGVTIPFADVGVLGSENTLYDERALVQMAGRSGRDARNPDGEVVFFHNGKTIEMLRARSHIRFMNQEGEPYRN